MTKKNFYSLIPVKLKSKRLKNKNLLKINKRSLLEISTESSLRSKFIKKTYVSTNSKKIVSICKKLDVNIVKRLKKYSSDEAKTSFVVNDFINQLDLAKDGNAYIVYLQPTSPLRTSTHIDSAIRKLIRSNKKCLISFKPQKNQILKSYYFKNKKFNPIIPGAITTNSEKLPKTFSPNGAIFIFSVKEFLKKKSIPSSNFVPYVMDEKTSIDIDTKEEFLKATKLMK